MVHRKGWASIGQSGCGKVVPLDATFEGLLYVIIVGILVSQDSSTNNRNSNENGKENGSYCSILLGIVFRLARHHGYASGKLAGYCPSHFRICSCVLESVALPKARGSLFESNCRSTSLKGRPLSHVSFDASYSLNSLKGVI